MSQGLLPRLLTPATAALVGYVGSSGAGFWSWLSRTGPGRPAQSRKQARRERPGGERAPPRLWKCWHVDVSYLEGTICLCSAFCKTALTSLIEAFLAIHETEPVLAVVGRLKAQSDRNRMDRRRHGDVGNLRLRSTQCRRLPSSILYASCAGLVQFGSLAHRVPCTQRMPRIQQ